MIITQSLRKIKKGESIAIVEIQFTNNYTIYIFKGSLSPNDILLKYQGPKSSRLRTPKHIHWAVDLLLKKTGDTNLTNSFLQKLKDYWESSNVLSGHSFTVIEKLINDAVSTIQLTDYIALDSYGEYPIDFLFVLMCLLAIQEKTNATANGQEAQMFGNVIDELLKNDLDIFKIMSTAGFGGR